MTLLWRFSAFLAIAVTAAACESGATYPTAPTSGTQPGIHSSSGSASAALTAMRLQATNGTSVKVTMAGQLSAATQTVSGRNDASSIVAKGNYTLTIGLDLLTLQCLKQAGSIPWEVGLVAFVQNHTPRSGALDINYKKPSGDPNEVDSWETQIDTYTYRFQFFRWSTFNSTINSDGSTTVLFRDGSVEVFKKKAGRMLSREQCFGAYLDYDLTAH